MKLLLPVAMTALLAATTVPAFSYAQPPAAGEAVQQLAAAEPDDAAFLFTLGLLEGHLSIGRELIGAGKTKLALPHFGHPVRELYDDMKDYLAAKGIAPFDDALIDLEAAVVQTPAGPETEAKYQAVLAKLHQARAAVPAAVRDSVPTMIKICSDTIEASAGEYGEAIERGKIENMVEYHDSRGFIGTVAQELQRLETANAATPDAGLIERFKTVLAKAQAVVGPLMPPEKPIKSVSDYRAIAEEATALSSR